MTTKTTTTKTTPKTTKKTTRKAADKASSKPPSTTTAKRSLTTKKVFLTVEWGELDGGKHPTIGPEVSGVFGSAAAAKARARTSDFGYDEEPVRQRREKDSNGSMRGCESSVIGVRGNRAWVVLQSYCADSYYGDTQSVAMALYLTEWEGSGEKERVGR